MRVRILKPFYHARKKRAYKPNEIVDAKKDEAELWMHHGMAMQDKSVEVPEKGVDYEFISNSISNIKSGKKLYTVQPRLDSNRIG